MLILFIVHLKLTFIQRLGCNISIKWKQYKHRKRVANRIRTRNEREKVGESMWD